MVDKYDLDRSSNQGVYDLPLVPVVNPVYLQTGEELYNYSSTSPLYLSTPQQTIEQRTGFVQQDTIVQVLGHTAHRYLCYLLGYPLSYQTRSLLLNPFLEPDSFGTVLKCIEFELPSTSGLNLITLRYDYLTKIQLTKSQESGVYYVKHMHGDETTGRNKTWYLACIDVDLGTSKTILQHYSISSTMLLGKQYFCTCPYFHDQGWNKISDYSGQLCKHLILIFVYWYILGGHPLPNWCRNSFQNRALGIFQAIFNPHVVKSGDRDVLYYSSDFKTGYISSSDPSLNKGFDNDDSYYETHDSEWYGSQRFDRYYRRIASRALQLTKILQSLEQESLDQLKSLQNQTQLWQGASNYGLDYYTIFSPEDSSIEPEDQLFFYQEKNLWWGWTPFDQAERILTRFGSSILHLGNYSTTTVTLVPSITNALLTTTLAVPTLLRNPLKYHIVLISHQQKQIYCTCEQSSKPQTSASFQVCSHLLVAIISRKESIKDWVQNAPTYSRMKSENARTICYKTLIGSPHQGSFQQDPSVQKSLEKKIKQITVFPNDEGLYFYLF